MRVVADDPVEGGGHGLGAELLHARSGDRMRAVELERATASSAPRAASSSAAARSAAGVSMGRPGSWVSGRAMSVMPP